MNMIERKVNEIGKMSRTDSNEIVSLSLWDPRARTATNQIEREDG